MFFFRKLFKMCANIWTQYPEGLVSEMLLYADDSTLLKAFNNSNYIDAFNTIQKDLKTIENWSTMWLLKFNKKETVHMIISNKLQRPQYPTTTLK